MKGKRGLIMGVANDHSIAWGIAQKLAEHGAEARLHLSGRGVRAARQAARRKDRRIAACCLATSRTAPRSTRSSRRWQAEWGRLDFLVHAIGFSDKNELKGLYADTSRDNFVRTMVISCYSFTEIARQAAALMPHGGSMLTLTYAGSVRVMPNYNVMGVAKAGLEASVRYLANDYGPRGIRVNAISAGPVRTLAGAGISDARHMFSYQQRNSPLRRTVTLDEVGGSALYLLSDLSSGVTGEIHYVDSGYHIVSMPTLES